MRKTVSAKDVAEKAGVSRTTVSFVLNNTPGKTISEETRQKVLQAAAELNYLPNDVARKLAMRKHRTIGLFICYNHYLFSDAYVISCVVPLLLVYTTLLTQRIPNALSRLGHKTSDNDGQRFN